MKKAILAITLVFMSGCMPLAMPYAPEKPPANATEEEKTAYINAMAAYEKRLNAIEGTAQTVSTILGFFGPQGAAAGGGVMALLAMWRKYRQVATAKTNTDVSTKEIVIGVENFIKEHKDNPVADALKTKLSKAMSANSKDMVKSLRAELIKET